MTARAGVRVYCPSRDLCGLATFHTHYSGSRSGASSRRFCSYCRAELVREPAVWGPVRHRGDGRYVRPEVTFSSPELAQRAADEANEAAPYGEADFVVRSFDPESPEVAA